MKLKVIKQIGQNMYEFEVEGENLFDVIMESQRLSFYDVEKCDVCQSTNLRLLANVAQGQYKYAKVYCNDCKASLTFGSKKDDPDTFYLRRDSDGKLDWKEYKGGE